MALIAMDLEGNTYFIFCRSPYTHNEMIVFLQQFPFKLVNAIYLEGGPETSLYVNVNGRIIEKNGSYISNSFPYDTNERFWKLPNVIGVKLKKWWKIYFPHFTTTINQTKKQFIYSLLDMRLANFFTSII